MKDDSLSDVSFCNTKEGMHIRAKELGINAYSLGCSCSDCIKGFDQMINSVGKQENVYAKQIWNDAIEAAAERVDKDTRCDQAGYEFGPALEIRKLKK